MHKQRKRRGNAMCEERLYSQQWGKNGATRAPSSLNNNRNGAQVERAQEKFSLLALLLKGVVLEIFGKNEPPDFPTIIVDLSKEINVFPSPVSVSVPLSRGRRARRTSFTIMVKGRHCENRINYSSREDPHLDGPPPLARPHNTWRFRWRKVQIIKI